MWDFKSHVCFSKEIAWLRTKFNSQYALFPFKHYIYSEWVSHVPFGSPVLQALRLGILGTTKSTSLSMNSPARWAAEATEVSRFCTHTVLSISFSTTHPNHFQLSMNSDPYEGAVNHSRCSCNTDQHNSSVRQQPTKYCFLKKKKKTQYPRLKLLKTSVYVI